MRSIPMGAWRVQWMMAIVVAVLLVWGPTAHAQELNCSVSVDYTQIDGSDFDFLGDLENEIQDYLNRRSWTDDDFQNAERISCSFQIIIREAVSMSEFEARLVVATLRPIYGTSQSTPVVRLSDSQWRFEYSRGEPLVFNLNRHDSLTSLLDFYAYIVLGYDYDTFNERGGTPFFERARDIADRAEASGGRGWSEVGGAESRANLVNQLLDSRFRPLRDAYYRYHLRGLDRFVDDTEEAREEVLAVIEDLEELSNTVSRSYAIDMFFSAKYQELAALFEGGSMETEAYNVLSQVDPSNLSEYNRLVE